ncbi:hypothetical protein BBD42_29680 [Paenibacillus sp. BIHB 4019]|uniref:Butirosin biosynthesis protein H N-terminal domain-containing protein n=1 Tax=Paenibacillus sp. BIHB 4019 TaxID=1870819 RepID=A0A1B2DR56_9BACL|nr:hypothetical protein [Paenibacillus sp. BIHB 4019]ANY70213.1 hypothetical protein BBD42_29680 [Paenibacillus sp. BIHB 4019]
MEMEITHKKPFAIRAGLHCLFSGLYHILERERPEAAAESDEADIYFETNGLNLEYYGDLNRVWLASQQDIVERFAQTYGLKPHASFEVELNPGAALLRLREAVLQGRMPLLFIRTTSLDYHEVFRDGEERNHLVLLLGWDDGSDSVLIGDSSFLDQAGHVTTYEGVLTVDALQKGLWGYAWFETDKERKPSSGSERFNAVLQNIRSFNQGLELPGQRYQGSLAYRIYVRDYAKLPALDAPAFSAVCRNVYYCFRVGGMLHQLEYLSAYIGRYEGRWPQEGQELLYRVEGLREKWRKALMQLYKVGLSVQRDKIGLLQDRFSLLLDEHEKLLCDLLKAVDEGQGTACR